MVALTLSVLANSLTLIRLCNVRFTSVRANIDLKNVTINARTGDFNPTSLAHVVNTETVNDLVVRTWLDRAGTAPHVLVGTSPLTAIFFLLSATRKSTLVFCVNLAHVRDLTGAFRKHGVDARYIYSKTPAAERRTLIDSFKGGRFPVLINCGTLIFSSGFFVLCLTCRPAILTEGADIPNIDCVVLARPTRSRNLFAQMVRQVCFRKSLRF